MRESRKAAEEGEQNSRLADELRRALARQRAARVERGEYGKLTFTVLGQMLAAWLGDPVPYSGEAVRTWITTGRDPGFPVSVALFSILAPEADLKELARATYSRRQPRGGKQRGESTPSKARPAFGARGTESARDELRDVTPEKEGQKAPSRRVTKVNAEVKQVHRRRRGEQAG